MNQIIVTGATAEFHSGVLYLSPEQAAPRLHCLNDMGDGFYDINKPVQFKRGEQLAYDGEINKAQFEKVNLVDLSEDIDPTEPTGDDDTDPKA